MKLFQEDQILDMLLNSSSVKGLVRNSISLSFCEM